jgi:hypothetical protein
VTIRSARALVLVGFLVTAAGAITALGETLYDFRGVTTQEVVYQLSVAVSYGLIGWAWWSILAPLGRTPEAILERSTHLPLKTFAVASAVLAVGWIGQIGEVESFRLHWRVISFEPRVVTFGWLVVAVGLCVAALGSWSASRFSQVESGNSDGADMREEAREVSRGDRFGVPMVVLFGYGLFILGAALNEWLTRDILSSIVKGEITSDISVVLGYGLLGIAWFRVMSQRSVAPRLINRRAYRALAFANGIVAIGYVQISWVFDGNPYRYRTFVSLIACAAGLGTVALGFWRASAHSSELYLQEPVIALRPN